ncbi:MAG: zinc ribbon domain-containing protein [Calditrichaeota bacterium]|nr:MAG: zinc ribbon domain-containing protein [Calditrichota bacterium]
MPTYEYQCIGCGHRFEEFQSMTAAPLTECPECSGKTERLISGGAGFVFKGAGFYQTDYRSKAYNEAASKDKPAATENKTDSNKTDSKPKTENKSDSK